MTQTTGDTLLPLPISPADALMKIIKPAVCDARSSNGTPLYRKVCTSCGAERMVDKRKIGKPCHPCAMKARSTHGMADSVLYARYAGMLARCKPSQANKYPYYAGRGIKVCAEWTADPAAFMVWAVDNGWAEGLEIDRKDTNGDYSPENCRFVPHAINSRNRRNARIDQAQANQIRAELQAGKPVAAVAKALGAPYMSVWHIANSGTWREMA